MQSGPTHSTTYVNAYRSGGYVHGNAVTRYHGQQTFLIGRNNAQTVIVMLAPGDRGYESAIDARTVLGDDWREDVESGVSTCLGD